MIRRALDSTTVSYFGLFHPFYGFCGEITSCPSWIVVVLSCGLVSFITFIGVWLFHVS